MLWAVIVRDRRGRRDRTEQDVTIPEELRPAGALVMARLVDVVSRASMHGSQRNAKDIGCPKKTPAPHALHHSLS